MMSPFRTSDDFPVFVDRSSPVDQSQGLSAPAAAAGDTPAMPAAPTHWWHRLRRRAPVGGGAAQSGSRAASTAHESDEFD